MKQPHEDIRGEDLSHLGHLLCLSDEAQAHRSLIVSTAHLVLNACLSVNPTPNQQQIDYRLRHPRVGDLVFEESSFWGSYRKGHPLEGNSWCRGFGFLVEERVEWWHTDADWASRLEDVDYFGLELGERPTDHAWYVQFGPAPEDICRWVNCSIVAIPVDPHEHLPYGPDRGLPRLTFEEVAQGAVLPKPKHHCETHGDDACRCGLPADPGDGSLPPTAALGSRD